MASGLRGATSMGLADHGRGAGAVTIIIDIIEISHLVDENDAQLGKRVAKLRRQSNGFLEQRLRCGQVGKGVALIEDRSRAQIEIHSVGIVRALMERTRRLHLDKRKIERAGNASNDLFLHRAQLVARDIEAVAAYVGACRGIDELRIDVERVAFDTQAAFEKVAHVQRAADLARGNGAASIGVGAATRDDGAARDMGKIRGEIVGDRIGQVVLLRIGAQIAEWQHGNGEPRCDMHLALQKAYADNREQEAEHGRGAEWP